MRQRRKQRRRRQERRGVISAAEADSEATATATRKAVAGKAAAKTEGKAVTKTTAATARTAEGREADRQRKQRRRRRRRRRRRQKRSNRVSCGADSSPTVQAACLWQYPPVRCYAMRVAGSQAREQPFNCKVRPLASQSTTYPLKANRLYFEGADRALNLKLTVSSKHLFVITQCRPRWGETRSES